MASHVSRAGARTIYLFAPVIDTQGRKVTKITFRPVCYNDVVDWQEGKFASIIAFAAELTGMGLRDFGCITYPDMDRVLSEFYLHVPAAIREHIDKQSVPQEATAQVPITPLADIPIDDAPPFDDEPKADPHDDDAGEEAPVHPHGIDMGEREDYTPWPAPLNQNS